VVIPSDLSIIKSKKYLVDDYEYRIFNYDGNYICDDDYKTGLYRSVIFSGLNDKLLSFSPPKSIKFDTFKSDKNNTKQTVTVTETVEGTMITLFYNADISKWEIATKSAVSGNYYYYRNEYFNDVKTQDSTFYNMFLDALQEPRTSCKPTLDTIPFISALDKSYCFSFVLQHPENHFVLNISRPRIFLVSVFAISGDNSVSYVPLPVYAKWDCFIGNVVEFPDVIDLDWVGGKKPDDIPYDKLVDLFGSFLAEPTVVGVNLVNNISGVRTVIENPRYNDLKDLRGNNPNIQYQYLCLMKINKIKDFLYHFPRYRQIFNKFKTQYIKFAQDVHSSYISYFVFKNREIPVSKRYLYHIYSLHKNYYIPSCIKNPALDPADVDNINAVDTVEPVKKKITKAVVFEYLKTIEPSVLIYYLNYDIYNM
jgi:hypothetical protein